MAKKDGLEDYPDIEYSSHFKTARQSTMPSERLQAIRESAQGFREEMLAGSQVVYYRSFELIHVPYPTRYGLLNACSVPTPFLHLLNKLVIVQYKTPAGIKTLLVGPADFEANRETPFFKRLAAGFGPFNKPMRKFLAPIIRTVEDCLHEAGLRAEDVDYITYDHLHTQDLRRWLGGRGRPAFFPNAKLLIMRQEWDSTLALLPPQRDWYCPSGLDGISLDKVVLLDGDVKLGEGVALIHTKGHTEGNHSVVTHTPEGLIVSSENGISADSYAPKQSKIPGLRKFAMETGMEVILNGNTQEGGLDQYLSMVQEKEIAGLSKRNPDFTNVVPSSELSAYWGFPGIKPTFRFGEMTFGSVLRG
jgi:hypothetical protein